MPKFYIHETTSSEVTFVREIEAADASEALDLDLDDGGTLIGIAVGDTKDGAPLWRDVHDALPHNLPVGFYPEPKTVQPDTPAMRSALSDALAFMPGAFDGGEDEINGGDLVEWFSGWRETAKAAISGAPPAPSDAPAPDPVDGVRTFAVTLMLDLTDGDDRMYGDGSAPLDLSADAIYQHLNGLLEHSTGMRVSRVVEVHSAAPADPVKAEMLAAARAVTSEAMLSHVAHHGDEATMPVRLGELRALAAAIARAEGEA